MEAVPPDARRKVDFIDPLFAVVLGIGLEKTVLGRDWFGQAGPGWVDGLVIGFGFLNIVLSWSGYHDSIERRPIRGTGRFVIDIVLLGLYLGLLLSHDRVGVVVIYFSMIFVLFLLWDWLKHLEYADGKGMRKRMRITVIWFGVSLFVGILYWVLELLHRFPALDSLTIALLYVTILGYRFHKAAELPTGGARQLKEGVAAVVLGNRDAEAPRSS